MCKTWTDISHKIKHKWLRNVKSWSPTLIKKKHITTNEAQLYVTKLTKKWWSSEDMKKTYTSIWDINWYSFIFLKLTMSYHLSEMKTNST